MNFISQYFIHITFSLMFRYDERAGSYEDIRRSISSEENFQMARERNPGFPFPPFALGGLGGIHAFSLFPLNLYILLREYVSLVEIHVCALPIVLAHLQRFHLVWTADTQCSVWHQTWEHLVWPAPSHLLQKVSNSSDHYSWLILFKSFKEVSVYF